MKKTVFIFLIFLKLYSQTTASARGEASALMGNVFFNVNETIWSVIITSLGAQSISNQTNPLPDNIMYFRKNSIVTAHFLFSANMVFPFLKDNIKDFSKIDNYESPIEDFFSNNLNLLGYNFGFQFFLKDNRPIINRFVFRFGYNFMAAGKGFNLISKISPGIKKAFSDSIAVGLDFHKLDAGLDITVVDSRYIDFIMGLSYSFGYKAFSMEGIIEERMMIQKKSYKIQTFYDLAYQSFSHALAFPLTMNVNLLGNNTIKMYLGYVFNFILSDRTTFKSNMKFVDSGNDIGQIYSVNPNLQKIGDRFKGKLYTGFHFYYTGVELYYIPNPDVIGLTLYVYMGI